MSVDLERARMRLAKADRLVSVGKFLFVAYILGVTVVLMVQLFLVQQSQIQQLEATKSSLNQSIEDNAEQHARTQDYIRCVANALLTPLALRSEAVFDRCGIDAQAGVSERATTEPGHASSVAPVPQVMTAPSSQQPTTSSPPDPDENDSDVEQQDEPEGLIRGVLGGVRGLIEGVF